MPRFDPTTANVSNAIRRLNPELFGLGRLPAANHQPNPLHAATRKDGRKKAGASCMARRHGGPFARVAFVVFRNRDADDDNTSAATLKWLRDAIAASLGLDDHQSQITWEYHQIKTAGAEGVAVKIETLSPSGNV